MPNQEKIKLREWVALKRRAKAMAEAGHTNSQIVAALGCKLATLQDWRRCGFESRSRYLTPDQIERLCTLYAEGASPTDMAKAVGRTISSASTSARNFATPEQRAARYKALGRVPRGRTKVSAALRAGLAPPCAPWLATKTPEQEAAHKASSMSASLRTQAHSTAEPGSKRTWEAMWPNGAPWLGGAVPAYPKPTTMGLC